MTTKEKRAELIDDAIIRQEELKRKAYFAWQDKKISKFVLESKISEIEEEKMAQINRIKKMESKKVVRHYEKLLKQRKKLQDN